MIYLYLLRRDKTDMKVITALNGGNCKAQRLDLERLDLPHPIHNSIKQIIYDNRMLWESWIEGANSTNDLIASLKARGLHFYIRKIESLLPLADLELTNNVEWQRQIDPICLKKMNLFPSSTP